MLIWTLNHPLPDSILLNCAQTIKSKLNESDKLIVGTDSRCYMLAHYFWNISRQLEYGSTVDATGDGIEYSNHYTRYNDPSERKTTSQIPMFVLGDSF